MRVVQSHKPGWQGGISLASHQPGGPVIGIAVSLVVHRDDVHQDYVLGLRIHSRKRHADGGEHPPDKKTEARFTLCKEPARIGEKGRRLEPPTKRFPISLLVFVVCLVLFMKLQRLSTETRLPSTPQKMNLYLLSRGLTDR